MEGLQIKNSLRRVFGDGFAVAIGFGVVFAVIRGVGMLSGLSYRPLIPLGFVLMMVLPFIFLTRDGRRQIGLTSSINARYYIWGILFGAVASAVCFALGLLLFGKSPDNWFVTILNYYKGNFPATDMPVNTLFVTFTIPAMIFSPIGEEIFFRGFLQDALSGRFSIRTCMVLESLFFGLVHLFHHGLVRTDTGIQFYAVSGLCWVALMSGTAYGFAVLRKFSHSLYPTMVAHATFNLVMNVFIFFVIY